VSGSGHGNSVDWWAFDVFLYELVYGRTPFKGHTKEATLKNILSKQATYLGFSLCSFARYFVLVLLTYLFA
jgi:serine/threonine protein kinase